MLGGHRISQDDLSSEKLSSGVSQTDKTNYYFTIHKLGATPAMGYREISF